MKKTIQIFTVAIAALFVCVGSAYAGNSFNNGIFLDGAEPEGTNTEYNDVIDTSPPKGSTTDVHDSLSRVHDSIIRNVHDSRDALTADIHDSREITDSRDSDDTGSKLDQSMDPFFDEMFDDLDTFEDLLDSDGSRDDSTADYRDTVENLRVKIEKLEGLVKNLIKEASPRGYVEEKIGRTRKCRNPSTGELVNCVRQIFGARG
jgi:hypothetical protein